MAGSAAGAGSETGGGAVTGLCSLDTGTVGVARGVADGVGRGFGFLVGLGGAGAEFLTVGVFVGAVVTGGAAVGAVVGVGATGSVGLERKSPSAAAPWPRRCCRRWPPEGGRAQLLLEGDERLRERARIERRGRDRGRREVNGRQVGEHDPRRCDRFPPGRVLERRGVAAQGRGHARRSRGDLERRIGDGEEGHPGVEDDGERAGPGDGRRCRRLRRRCRCRRRGRPRGCCSDPTWGCRAAARRCRSTGPAHVAGPRRSR